MNSKKHIIYILFLYFFSNLFTASDIRRQMVRWQLIPTEQWDGETGKKITMHEQTFAFSFPSLVCVKAFKIWNEVGFLLANTIIQPLMFANFIYRIYMFSRSKYVWKQSHSLYIRSVHPITSQFKIYLGINFQTEKYVYINVTQTVSDSLTSFNYIIGLVGSKWQIRE